MILKIITIPKSTTNIHIHHFKTAFHVSRVHCGSAVRFGRALPGFHITAHHLAAKCGGKTKTKIRSLRSMVGVPFDS